MGTAGTERAAAVNARIQKSADEFNTAVQDFTKNLVPEQLMLLHKKIALEALRRVVLKTPVDTGRARGNWQTTVDQAPSTTVLATKIKTGKHTRTTNQQSAIAASAAATAMATGSTAIAKIQPFSTTYITNNVPYIIWLEDGSSKQAPSGMVKVTIEELRQMFP